MKTVIRMLVLLSLLSSHTAIGETRCQGQPEDLVKTVEENLKDGYLAAIHTSNTKIETIAQFDSRVLSKVECVMGSDGLSQYTGNRLDPVVYSQEIDLHVFTSKIRKLDGYKKTDKRADIEESFVGTSVFGDVVRITIDRISSERAIVSFEIHMCEVKIPDFFKDESFTLEQVGIEIVDTPELDAGFFREDGLGDIRIFDFNILVKSKQGGDVLPFGTFAFRL